MIFTRHVGNPAFDNALNVVADQRSGNRRHRHREDGDPQNNHRHGEEPGIGAVRHDVAKADGRHHNNGEIERRRQVVDLGGELIAQVQRAQRAVDNQRGDTDDRKEAAGG